MGSEDLSSLVGGDGASDCPVCGRKDCSRLETHQKPDYPLLPAGGDVEDEAPAPINAKRGRRTRHHPRPSEDR